MRRSYLIDLRFAVVIVVAQATMHCHSSVYAADAQKQLQAGAYAIDITPTKFPVESAGGMRPRIAERAHDPLHARCLVIDNGDMKIAFAICDSCMIPRDIFDEAKEIASRETGIPTQHILASATHTHTAVTATPTFQSKVENEYCDMLTQRIAEGIIKAASHLEPAHIGWAVGHNPRHVFNRRWYMRRGFLMDDPFDRGTDKVKMNPPRADSKLLKPAGPTDPEVAILAVQARDGHPRTSHIGRLRDVAGQIELSRRGCRAKDS